MKFSINSLFLVVFVSENVVSIKNSGMQQTYSQSDTNGSITIIADQMMNSSQIVDDLDDSNSLGISKNCSLGLELFTEKVTNLTRCIVINARPIGLCMNCEKYFTATADAYKNLKEEPAPCHKFYFESDQIGIINQVYDQGNDLWLQNNCQNCHDYINDTLEFFKVAKDFENCFKKYNGTSESERNNTCDMCQEFFVKQNTIYKTFVQRVSEDINGGVCMDIVDKMNITRHIWSSQNCLRFDSYIGYPNIITAVLVGAMPIFFYMLSKNISIIEDVKLVRPKRKSFASLASDSVPSD